MERTRDLKGLAVLKRPWKRWTAVVHHCVRSRPQSDLNDADYRALYMELLGDCQKLGDNGDVATQQYARFMQSIIRPWLTRHTLEQADREILLDLLKRCRRIDQELNGRNWSDVLVVWLWPTLAAIAGAASVMLVIVIANGLSRRVNDWVDVQGRQFRIAFEAATMIQRVMAIGFALAIVTVLAVHHIRKT